MMLPKPNDGFVWVQAAAGPALVCSALRPFADHLFTTRLWALGSALGPAPESAWEEVARALAVDPAHLIRAHQVHGASVVVRRASRDAPSPATPADLPDADILVSDDARLALAIQTADCVPLLMADRRTGAVAAAHAGWRGLAAGVIENVVRAMGVAPESLIVYLGPAIGAGAYEVGADVFDAFVASDPDAATAFALRGAGKFLADLNLLARRRLGQLGVARIHGGNLCTYSDPERLYSYRRDGATGRMASLVWME